MHPVKKFVDYMNTKHCIYFTFEIENQKSFSFFDIKNITNTDKKAFETATSYSYDINNCVVRDCYFVVFLIRSSCEKFNK